MVVPIALGEMSVQLKPSANPFGPWGVFLLGISQHWPQKDLGP